MKKIFLILLAGIVLYPLGAVENFKLPESFYAGYEENVLSKYFNSDSEESISFIRNNNDSITMEFTPNFLGFSQGLENSSVIISPDNFKIVLYDDEVEIPDEIEIQFDLVDGITGKFTESLKVNFTHDDNILYPASSDDFQSLIDFLAVGRGYVKFWGYKESFHISEKMDIYYIDLLFCSLWMDADIIPDLGWYDLLK